MSECLFWSTAEYDLIKSYSYSISIIDISRFDFIYLIYDKKNIESH